MWTKCGQNVEIMWKKVEKCGTNVEKRCAGAPEIVEKMWKQCGTNVEQLWTNVGKLWNKFGRK